MSGMISIDRLVDRQTYRGERVDPTMIPSYPCKGISCQGIESNGKKVENVCYSSTGRIRIRFTRRNGEKERKRIRRASWEKFWAISGAPVAIAASNNWYDALLQVSNMLLQYHGSLLYPNIICDSTTVVKTDDKNVAATQTQGKRSSLFIVALSVKIEPLMMPVFIRPPIAPKPATLPVTSLPFTWAPIMATNSPATALTAMLKTERIMCILNGTRLLSFQTQPEQN